MTNFQTYRPSLDEILNGTPLTPAEKRLLAACKRNGGVSFGDEVPEEATPENSIRGELIRYLMMGGCDDHQPNAQGVIIVGAVITGQMNLDGCLSPLDLWVMSCRFDNTPDLRNAEIGALLLRGSHLPGLLGDQLRVKRNLWFDTGFQSSSPIILMGAQVGGQLACVGGRFEAQEGPAVRAHRLSVSGDVFFGDGFHARGLVDLTGAQIGGQLACAGGKFEVKDGPAFAAHRLAVSGSVFLSEGFHASGLVDLNSARIGGQLACNGGVFEDGLDIQNVKVGEDFLFRSLQRFRGLCDLSDAHVACLCDDMWSWGLPGRLELNGFRFDTVQSQMSVTDRLQVLAKYADQEEDTEFESQPYTQLAGFYSGFGICF